MKFLKSLKKWDIYAHRLGITYNGEGKYATHMGTFFTFLVYFIILYHAALLFTAFSSKSNAEQKFGFSHIDLYDGREFSFEDNNFEVAFFFAKKIPKKFGRILAQLKVKCQPGGDGPDRG